MSLCRQNFTDASLNAINEQINFEMRASYTYQSMAAYFSRDVVALKGFAAYFRKQSEEEREHALKLSDYICNRGGRVVLHPIPAPESDWKSAKNALEQVLQLERDVNEALLKLHKLADEQADPHLADFLEAEYLQEQVHSLKEVAELLTNLNRVGGDGLGLFIFDRELLGSVSGK